MFSSEQYRAKAAEYLGLETHSPEEIRQFRDLERRYTVLADNEEWLEHNFDKTVNASDKDRLRRRARCGRRAYSALPRSCGYHRVEHHPQEASEGAVRQCGLHG
jgi:hypothetical protein